MKGLLFEILRDIEAERGRTIVGGETRRLFVAGAGPGTCLWVSGSPGNVTGETVIESCREAVQGLLCTLSLIKSTGRTG